MRVLLVGSGGREHALACTLARSPGLSALYAAPGSDALAAIATCLPVAADDLPALVATARAQSIDLVVIGPEAPLVLGLVDALQAAGIAAFGPTAAAARLEGSKSFTKALCARAGIPTAHYSYHTQLEAARAALDEFTLPVVIKADGLAAGKGVTIAPDRAAAEAALESVFQAGGPVVIEEFLPGREMSFFVLTDGDTALPLATAEDHKAAYDGDTGPNTGGMGAFSPSPLATPALEAAVMADIIAPTLAAMRAAGTPFCGILYAGLMLTADGPKLLEYNTRFGDPECQALMLRLQSDLLPLLMAAATGRLAEASAPLWSPGTAVVVVMAAHGYPGRPQTGSIITGLEAARASGATLYEAATQHRGGVVLAAGGRVLNIGAMGRDLDTARQAAYKAVDAVNWPGGFCRRDIGARDFAAGLESA